MVKSKKNNYAKINKISNWYRMNMDIHENRAMTKFSLKFSVGNLQGANFQSCMRRK